MRTSGKDRNVTSIINENDLEAVNNLSTCCTTEWYKM